MSVDDVERTFSFSFDATIYAIVNDRLSALELVITPDMGHDGWASDLITRRFHLYKNTKVSMGTP